jgi:hypothetical protein
MIQRIQTIYLVMVNIFALLFIFLPIGTLEYASLIYHIGFMGIIADDGTQTLEYSGMLRTLIMIIPFLIMILTTYTIFIYRNRPLQISLGRLNMLIHILLVVLTFFYLDNIKNQFEGLFSYGAAIMFPLINMVWLLLANRAIARDEKLVRSADRLR